MRHMATDAVLCRGPARGIAGFGRVASQTLRIVRCSRSFDGAVRIVAGGAANPVVSGIVALTVAQSVRLKLNVLDSLRAVGRDLRPGAMTLAAEVRHLLSREIAEHAHGCLS